MKNKSPGFHFYPEKFIAGTRHLCETDRAIFIDMMCNIWTLRASQVTFPDTIPMWMTLTGLNDRERVEKIRKRLMFPGMEMFGKKKTKNGIFLVQKGMRKEMRKQKKNNVQNSKNAISGWGKRKSKYASAEIPQCASKDSAMRSVSSSFSFSNSNKTAARSFDTIKAKAQRAEIGKMLAVYLNDQMIDNVFKFMPGVPYAYIAEKIQLTVKRKPSKMGPFLYAAIMQNYQPEDNGGEDIADWMKKALKRDLTKKEFNSVPEKEKERFEEIKKEGPDIIEFELISKPEKTKSYVEKKLFAQMEIGERVESFAFKKLRKELHEYFKKITTSGRIEKIYHLQ